MSDAIRPSYSESVVLAPWAINGAGGLKSVTLDLRTKVGAFLKIGVGLSGSTNLTNGVDVLAFRTLNNAAGAEYSAPYFSARSGNVVGARLINNASGYTAGTNSFAYDGTGGTLFSIGDTLCFWGTATVPSAEGAITTNGVEFLRCSKGTTTPLVTSTACTIAKVDNEVFCQGNTWDVWLEGGATYELVFDSGNNAAGGYVACKADAQIYDYDLKVTV